MLILIPDQYPPNTILLYKLAINDQSTPLSQTTTV